MARQLSIRLGLNFGRLVLTLGLGVVSVRLVAGLGETALALYLFLLGWRWLFQFLIDATEAAGLAHLAEGNDVGEIGIRRYAGLASVAICCSAPMGWSLFPAEWQMTLITGAMATACVVGSQIVTAGVMADLVLSGQMGRYNLVVLARRGAEFGALALALVLTPEAQIALGIFHVGLALTAFALVLPLRRKAIQRRTRGGGPKLSYEARVRQAAVAGLATSLAARSPAVILPALGGDGLTVAAGLMVLFLGYSRQAGSVFLSGHDGLMRAGDPQRGVAILIRVSALAGPALTLLLLPVAPVLFRLMIGPQALGSLSTAPDWALAVRVLALAAVVRLTADAWVKTLGGYGRIGPAAWRMGGFGLVYLAGLAALATMVEDRGTVLVGTAAAYLGLQVVQLVWALAPGMAALGRIGVAPLRAIALAPIAVAMPFLWLA